MHHERRLRVLENLLKVEASQTAHDRQRWLLAKALLNKKLQITINLQRKEELGVLPFFSLRVSKLC